MLQNFSFYYEKFANFAKVKNRWEILHISKCTLKTHFWGQTDLRQMQDDDTIKQKQLSLLIHLSFSRVTTIKFKTAAIKKTVYFKIYTKKVSKHGPWTMGCGCIHRPLKIGVGLMASERKRKPFNDVCIIALYRWHRLVGWFLLSRLDRVLLGKWTIDCPDKSPSCARNFFPDICK